MTLDQLMWFGIAGMFAISLLSVALHPLLGVLWFAIWNGVGVFVYAGCKASELPLENSEPKCTDKG